MMVAPAIESPSEIFWRISAIAATKPSVRIKISGTLIKITMIHLVPKDIVSNFIGRQTLGYSGDAASDQFKVSIPEYKFAKQAPLGATFSRETDALRDKRCRATTAISCMVTSGILLIGGSVVGSDLGS